MCSPFSVINNMLFSVPNTVIFCRLITVCYTQTFCQWFVTGIHWVARWVVPQFHSSLPINWAWFSVGKKFMADADTNHIQKISSIRWTTVEKLRWVYGTTHHAIRGFLVIFFCQHRTTQVALFVCVISIIQHRRVHHGIRCDGYSQ